MLRPESAWMAAAVWDDFLFPGMRTARLEPGLTVFSLSVLLTLHWRDMSVIS